MKNTIRHSRMNRRFAPGFLMLEALLAIGVFSIAVTGFAVALSRTADLAALAQREVAVVRLLESSLTEAMSYPDLAAGSWVTEIPEMADAGMTVETIIEELPEMTNEDGNILQNMFRISVVARWWENELEREEVAETWRYAQMYLSP